jgi:acid phosphatase
MLGIGGKDGSLSRGRGGEKRIQFGLSGCHDTTLAAVLSSLGAFEGEKWPAYSSHLAVELFRREGHQEYSSPEDEKPLQSRMLSFGSSKRTKEAEGGISRKAFDHLSQAEGEKMDGYFVRLRYNDRPMTVPGCRLSGKHLEGNESFCTLVSY